MSEFYLWIEGREKGPFRAEELLRMIRQKEVTTSAGARRGRGGQWGTLGEMLQQAQIEELDAAAARNQPKASPDDEMATQGGRMLMILGVGWLVFCWLFAPTVVPVLLGIGACVVGALLLCVGMLRHIARMK